jgi:hypothetical protein
MRLILPAAIAASVSWELASLVFTNSSPLFAPFAAIVGLASGHGQRSRRKWLDLPLEGKHRHRLA